MQVVAYIALGGNLGDRRAYLDQALAALRSESRISIRKVSRYYETAPVGGPANQGAFLNAAAELETDLEPQALLSLLLDVERKLGRVRHERHGPRTIDLDLLLYGDRVCREPGLTLPHPRMHERVFVLEPLVEIAPDVLHPGSGVPVRILLNRLRARPEASPPVPGRELGGLRALVTGSSSGIGRAIAMELAAAGADVMVHRRGPRTEADAVADAIRARGSRSHVILTDLSDAGACRGLVETAWNLWNGIDIWINNAGADTLTGESAQWSFERKLQELLAVDVTATMLLARAVGGRMKARGSGVLLNMGWDQADRGMEGDSGQLFGAAKAAVMAFTKSLAVTLAPEVRVNCLAPGWIRTAWGENVSVPWQERVKRETPLRRWGTPQDVAAAARWLVSPAAAYITGQIVRIDGGAIR